VSAPHNLSAAWADADALRAKGQLTAARDLLEPVADVAAIRLGSDDPDVIETMRRLAVVHRELGELASARRVLEEALEGAQLRLTDDSPVVLGISAELGALADELGNRHEARRNMSRVARFGPAVLGEQHPYVRAAQRFLGTEAAPVAPPEPVSQPEPVAPQPRPPVLEQPGVYRPAEPVPLPEPEPVPELAPPPELAPAPESWRPRHSAEPEEPQPRLEHSALPWYQKTDPEPIDPFTPYPSPRFGIDDEEERPRRSRTPLLVLGVMGLALLVAVVAVGLVLLIRPRPSTTAGPGPTAVSSGVTTPGAAPTDVKLRDEGATVTLTWTDPTSGTVPFFVEVGKPGTQLQLYSTLPQGETRYSVAGLNPRLDYCFSVIAVYGTNVVAPSNLVCTQRAGNSAPSPNR
jgi:Tetratricopeptide repeat/Fibronectin type III domain